MTFYSNHSRASFQISKPLLMLFLGDLALLACSFYVGVFSRWADLTAFGPSILEHLPQAVTFMSVIGAMMFAVGLYSRDIEHKATMVALRLIVALFMSFVVLTVIFYIFPDLIIWRSALLISLSLTLPAIFAWRLIWLTFVDRDEIKRRIIVIGAGSQAEFIEQMQQKGQICPFRCLGYVALHGEEECVPFSRIIPNNRPLRELVRELRAREIVVATDDWRNRLSIEELLQCKLDGVRIWDYLSFREEETGSVDLSAIRPSWFIFSGGFPGGPLEQSLKRIFDLVVGTLSFLLFLPLFCATAIAIRLESPGPIFHLQERIGLNGRRFVALKFRSMREDAEIDGVPKWAQEDDPRVTAVGRVIRRTRIDEIPQIINVLRGEMSFVGPRPERPFFVDQLADEIPYYHERHRVKPGITGWAQLKYIYGASVEGAKQKLQYDLYYVKHYSIILDFLIILQTVRVILWPQGVR